MQITQEQFNLLSDKYKYWLHDLICQNMSFFKFRKQPKWGFMFDERVAFLGMANKETNTIAFNIASIDFAFRIEQSLMIEQYALHEFRHLYQYGEIESYKTGYYDGAEDIEKVKRWEYEYEHYIGPENNGQKTVNEYYDQDLEFDAFTFAYAAMKFKYKQALPDYIEMPKYYVGKYEAIAEEWYKKFSEIFK